MVEYESFFAPQNYWNSLNKMKKTSYIKKYYAEKGVYPTQVQINSIILSEEEIEKYNRYYYAKYLAKLSANGDLSDSETNDPSIEYDNTPNFSEWIELPFVYKSDAESLDECLDENLEYYCHYFSVGDEKYRNYSFAWSQKDRISKWVAYPLHKNSVYLEDNVARTDAYALDPILGENSSAPFNQYAGTYARGKQIPSIHRIYSEECNSQVFYGSNIIPIDNKIYEEVENILNSYILLRARNSQECYVVSGVITDENSIIVKDSYDNNVTVPNRIYKFAFFVDGTLSHYICCSYNNNADNIDLRYHNLPNSFESEGLTKMTGLLYFYNMLRTNEYYEKCFNSIPIYSDTISSLDKYMQI